MPIRLLREGILSSDRVDQLDFAAEVFYRRLMSKVDDFGLYDARPSVLRSSLYPLRVDRVREADIARWIAICETAGVIALYDDGGKPYLQMRDTNWKTRSMPKWPVPPWGLESDNSCEQPLAIAPVFGVVVDVEVDKSSRKRLPPPDGVSELVWKDFQQLRRAKKSPVTDTAIAGIRREADKAGFTLQQALETCCQRGWQGFKAEWIEGKASPTTTVPSRAGPDPALAKLDADSKKAAPIPPAIREQMAKLKGKTFV